MNHKDFLQVIFKSNELLTQNIAGNRANPLIDLTLFAILDEIRPYLKKDLTKEETDNIEDRIIDRLVDLSDYSVRIGIDTASMLLTGTDPFDTYSKKSFVNKLLRKKHLAGLADQTK